LIKQHIGRKKEQQRMPFSCPAICVCGFSNAYTAPSKESVLWSFEKNLNSPQIQSIAVWLKRFIGLSHYKFAEMEIKTAMKAMERLVKRLHWENRSLSPYRKTISPSNQSLFANEVKSNSTDLTTELTNGLTTELTNGLTNELSDDKTEDLNFSLRSHQQPAYGDVSQTNRTTTTQFDKKKCSTIFIPSARRSFLLINDTKAVESHASVTVSTFPTVDATATVDVTGDAAPLAAGLLSDIQAQLCSMIQKVDVVQSELNLMNTTTTTTAKKPTTTLNENTLSMMNSCMAINDESSLSPIKTKTGDKKSPKVCSPLIPLSHPQSKNTPTVWQFNSESDKKSWPSDLKKSTTGTDTMPTPLYSHHQKKVESSAVG
jgi:hypothetical protein